MEIELFCAGIIFVNHLWLGFWYGILCYFLNSTTAFQHGKEQEITNSLWLIGWREIICQAKHVHVIPTPEI